MPKSTLPSEADIRQQAYFFWEEDGRPAGRETEYWMRATVALSDKASAETLAAPPPRKSRAADADKPPSKLKSAATKAVKKPSESPPKATPKLKSAATKAKPAPSKSAKPDGKKK